MAQPQLAAQALSLHCIRMNVFQSYISLLDSGAGNEELKLKAILEIRDNFEAIASSPHYEIFLKHSVEVFLRVLAKDPYMIMELPQQKVRKLILDVIHRFPRNNSLRSHIEEIVVAMIMIFKKDNAENVLIALRILDDLLCTYKPSMLTEVLQFLDMIYLMYEELPHHMPQMFQTSRISNIEEQSKKDLKAGHVLYTPVPASIQVINASSSVPMKMKTFLPAANHSLKVLRELPKIVLQVYQCYGDQVVEVVTNLIQTFLKTINMVAEPHPSNRMDLIHDFISVQIKVMTVLTSMIPPVDIGQKEIALVLGMMKLLQVCPAGAPTLRKELLEALHRFFLNNSADCFLPYVWRLCKDEFLLGTGYMPYQSLGPIGFSAVAVLVRKHWDHMPQSDIAAVVHLFTRNLLDDTLPLSMHRESCNFLASLVETVSHWGVRTDLSWELNARVLQAVALKLKSVVQNKLPRLKTKSLLKPASTAKAENTAGEASKSAEQQPQPNPNASNATASNSTSTSRCKSMNLVMGILTDDDLLQITAVECRQLVQDLIAAAKKITALYPICIGVFPYPFQFGDASVFLYLVKWLLRALTVFNSTAMASPKTQDAAARKQDEAALHKQRLVVLRSVASLFKDVAPVARRSIYSRCLVLFAAEIPNDANLLSLASFLMTHADTALSFTDAALTYLVPRLVDAQDATVAALFDAVFRSLHVQPENASVIGPLVANIVSRSLDLAQPAKEPQHNLRVLRSMFRYSVPTLAAAISSLLPGTLLRLTDFLNSGPGGEASDVLVELCLTIPTQVERLAPWLDRLMSVVLVGLQSSTLRVILQSLKSLHCILDHLSLAVVLAQTDVPALNRALWHLLHHSAEQVSCSALDALGKLGSANHAALDEARVLDFRELEPEPAVAAHFNGVVGTLDVPVRRVVELAVSMLRDPNTEAYYRQHCWEVLQTFLAASLVLEDDNVTMRQLLVHPSFVDPNCHITPLTGELYKLSDKTARELHKTALIGVFLAASMPDLRSKALPMIIFVATYYTMLAIVRQAGPLASCRPDLHNRGMDPLVFVDAISAVLCSEESESDRIRPAILALVISAKAMTVFVGSLHRACRLPLLEYMFQRTSLLCYQRNWRVKKGGVYALKFFLDHTECWWIVQHFLPLYKALFFAATNQNNQMSRGTIDRAKPLLDKLFTMSTRLPVASDIESASQLLEAQKTAINAVTRELVVNLLSHDKSARELVVHLLTMLARLTNNCVSAMLVPHQALLKEKLVMSVTKLKGLMLHGLIAVFDTYAFINTINPRFSDDLSVENNTQLTNTLLHICQSDDATAAHNLQCVCNAADLVAVRMSALRALSTCHRVVAMRMKLVSLFLEVLAVDVKALQEAAFHALSTYLANIGGEVFASIFAAETGLMLGYLSGVATPTLGQLRRTLYLVSLMPKLGSWLLNSGLNTQHARLCNTHAQHAASGTTCPDVTAKLSLCLDIYAALRDLSKELVAQLCSMHVCSAQLAGPNYPQLTTDTAEALVKVLVLRPEHTVDFFLVEENVLNRHASSFFLDLLRGSNGTAFCCAVQLKPERLCHLLDAQDVLTVQERRYVVVSVAAEVTKRDKQWLVGRTPVSESLWRVWRQDDFHLLYTSSDRLKVRYMKVARLLGKILLQYFKLNPCDVEELFQLLRPFCSRYFTDFMFLETYLSTIVPHYAETWKRAAILQALSSAHHSAQLKAEVLMRIVAPCCAITFTQGHPTALLEPAPGERGDNLVCMFIAKMVDFKNPLQVADCLRIAVLRMLCLFLHHVPQQITSSHEAVGSNAAPQFQQVVAYAWPSLEDRLLDPTSRCLGYLLLAHISLQKNRLLHQVALGLLRWHEPECSELVQHTLDQLTPPVATSLMGARILHQCLKTALGEAGGDVARIAHIMRSIVRSSHVYFHLIPHGLLRIMVKSVPVLGLSEQSRHEHRCLALDVINTVIKWQQWGNSENTNEMQLWLKRAHLRQQMTEAVKNNTAIRAASPSKMAPSFLRFSQGRFLHVPTTRAGRQNMPGPSGVRPFMAEACRGKPRVLRARQPDPVAAPLPVQQSPLQLLECSALEVTNLLLAISCPSAFGMPASPDTSDRHYITTRCISQLRGAVRTRLLVNWSLTAAQRMARACSNPGTDVSAALKVLTEVVPALTQAQVLELMAQLGASVEMCAGSGDADVVQSLHLLVRKVVSLITPWHQALTPELQNLHQRISLLLTEALASYEDSSSPITAKFYYSVLTLDTLNVDSLVDIELFRPTVVRVLEGLTERAVGKKPDVEEEWSESKLLIGCLNLLRHRFCTLPSAQQTSFLDSVMQLVCKLEDAAVLVAIVKMLNDWLTDRVDDECNESPTLTKCFALVVAIVENVTQRFPKQARLRDELLQGIHLIYKEKSLRQVGDAAKTLIPAFLFGLSSESPEWRSRFTLLFDSFNKRKLPARLVDIYDTDMWGYMRSQDWIKHTIGLVFGTAMATPYSIQMSNSNQQLMGTLSIVQLANREMSAAFAADRTLPDIKNPQGASPELLKELNSVAGGLVALKDLRASVFLRAVAQLCHYDESLSAHIWNQVMPRFWSLLTPEQQITACKLKQVIAQPAPTESEGAFSKAVGTFVEGLTLCKPAVEIQHDLARFLGKTYNLRHRMALTLESITEQNSAFGSQLKVSKYSEASRLEQFKSLAALYESLDEKDMLAGDGLKFLRYSEAGVAVALHQQGRCSEALASYQRVAADFMAGTAVASDATLWQMKVVDDVMVSCLRDLNQWESLHMLDGLPGAGGAHRLMESAWRLGDWRRLESVLESCENDCPAQLRVKMLLYRGYLAICDAGNRNLVVARHCAQAARKLCIEDWRRLPRSVAHTHLPTLHNAQAVCELEEAVRVVWVVVPVSASSSPQAMWRWDDRLPALVEPLTRCSEVLAWRQHVYSTTMERRRLRPDRCFAMALRCSQKATLRFSEAAQRQGLSDVCLSLLNTLPDDLSESNVGNFISRLQLELKCCQLRPEDGEDKLKQLLGVIQSTDPTGFPRPMMSEFFTAKAEVLSLLGYVDHAGSNFCSATQLYAGATTYAAWARHLETQEDADASDVVYAYLHACGRDLNATHNCLAKVLNLLAQDTTGTLGREVSCNDLPTHYWLPWLPQLLHCCAQPSGGPLSDLIFKIGRQYPQAVFPPLRNFYLMLKTAFERHQTDGAAPASTEGVDNVVIRFRSIMIQLFQFHHCILSVLDEFLNQLSKLESNAYQRLATELQRCLERSLLTLFESEVSCSETYVTTEEAHSLSRCISEFGKMQHTSSSMRSGVEERFLTLLKDDLEFEPYEMRTVGNLVPLLRKWITIIHDKCASGPSSYLLLKKCRFPSASYLQLSEIVLPGDYTSFQQCFGHRVTVETLHPEVRIVSHTAIIGLRGSNGRTYEYAVVRDRDIARKERVAQVLHAFNMSMATDKECHRRGLRYTLPRVLTVQPTVRLIERNPSSVTLWNVFNRACTEEKRDPYITVSDYYQLLTAFQSEAAGNESMHAMRLRLHKLVYGSVDHTYLKTWAITTYPDASEFWTFRKTFATQLGLLSLAEHALHLTSLTPDVLLINRDTGLLPVPSFLFHAVHQGKTVTLAVNHAVPFRLTPNISRLLGPASISGPMKAAMIAAASCLVKADSDMDSLLRAVLRDEVIAMLNKKQHVSVSAPPGDVAMLSRMIAKWTQAIIARLTNASVFYADNGGAATLINDAQSVDRLCHSNPTWMPFL